MNPYNGANIELNIERNIEPIIEPNIESNIEPNIEPKHVGTELGQAQLKLGLHFTQTNICGIELFHK